MLLQELVLRLGCGTSFLPEDCSDDGKYDKCSDAAASAATCASTDAEPVARSRLRVIVVAVVRVLNFRARQDSPMVFPARSKEIVGVSRECIDVDGIFADILRYITEPYTRPSRPKRQESIGTTECNEKLRSSVDLSAGRGAYCMQQQSRRGFRQRLDLCSSPGKHWKAAEDAAIRQLRANCPGAGAEHF